MGYQTTECDSSRYTQWLFMVWNVYQSSLYPAELYSYSDATTSNPHNADKMPHHSGLPTTNNLSGEISHGIFFLDWGGREEGVRTAASEARKLNQSPAASFSTRHHEKIALLVNQNISSIFMAQNIPLSFQISLIMKSLRGAILFEKKGSPLMSKEEENERPLALEPCPPLKSYLLRPSGSTRMFEPQVSHMSKNFNSSFAKQARKWA